MKNFLVPLATLLLAWLAPAAAQPQLQLSVNLPNDPVAYGDPLIIEMHVENVGDEASGVFSIGSSNFHRIYYFGDTQEGCELLIAPTEIPELIPMPPLFGFLWPDLILQPGESRLCRVTFPMILYPGGGETIDLDFYTGNGAMSGTSFTYTLLGEPAAPAQPVPTVGWPALVLFASLIVTVGCIVQRRWACMNRPFG
jgi:hypothetical protein